MVTVVALLFSFLQFQTSQARYRWTVHTSSGEVTGFINKTTPNVAQFLGVPFAESPEGPLRWLPPVLKSRKGRIDATAFGNNCPQYLGNLTTVYSEDATGFVTPQNIGEDCLSVSIWAPKKECSETGSLPVIAWLYGGGFNEGGANVPYQNPAKWVERSQKHIVVSINYRVNIFGFPNAAGLKDDEQNLGFLDQRLGLEWIRRNIANFGGDPNRITVWGQSAGAMSADYLNFAYLEDPIISGLIMDSGTAQIQGYSVDGLDHSNFTFVATHFGCGNLSAKAELDCLRNVSSEDIIALIKERSDAGTTPALMFVATVDNRTLFANYTERALVGNFSKKPAIVGTNADEATSFTLPYDRANGPDIKAAHLTTLGLFLCPAVKTTQDRYAGDPSTATYRYLYGGNFTNISPQWWEGAFHSSELPLVFGTHDLLRGPSTPFEIAVSEKMQDYWVAFAEDPVNGLPKMGWNAYEPTGDAVLIGWHDVVSQPIAEARLEAPCDGLIPRPGALPPP
ncbi:para-nitrobenzyl esterase [Lentithecium fluviatile CBS 122367]|uniref:Carboxylic ester hydrolase n=1 Tax=Lentithecium fluviatile CBS 122367 TaxID=1168545 RepID=A0A6G1J1J9_9PLEO|nr:para-nitrobenzyl esterase [Lentithecium fluviatile CBS 122367]